MLLKGRKKGTGRKPITGKRKSKANRLGQRARQLLVWFGVVLFVVWLCAWLVLSGFFQSAGGWIHEKVISISVDSGLVVRNILVEGRYFTDAEALEAVLNTPEGSPILEFNPQEARRFIEKLSWVESAEVQRVFPDTVYIRIHEKQPVALWQNKGKVAPIDVKGNVLLADSLDDFRHLVLVVGKGANLKAKGIVDLLMAEPELRKRTEAAVLVSGRRWDLKMKNGAVVKLPEYDMILAARRLVLKHESEGILDKKVNVIDIRNPDRITVRTRPGAVMEYKTGM